MAVGVTVGDGVGVVLSVGVGVAVVVLVGDGAGVVLGVGVGVLVYVTVIVSVLVLPALSVAVTVIVLSPFDKLIFKIDQLVVPLAVPVPPLLLLHFTLLTPLLLSDALPLRLTTLLVVV